MTIRKYSNNFNAHVYVFRFIFPLDFYQPSNFIY